MSFFSSLIKMAEKSNELSKKVEEHLEKKDSKPNNKNHNPKNKERINAIHYETYSDMTSVEKDLYKNDEHYRKVKDDLVYQDSLLKEINEAREKYNTGGDINETIKVFEHAFIEADPPCRSSQDLFLAELYLKNNQNDKAWGYLERLKYNSGKLLSDGDSIVPYTMQNFCAQSARIASLQGKILKQEKRYEEAIKQYMISSLYDLWSYEGRKAFNKEKFFKDIKVCANKLNWDEDRREYLAYLIENNGRRTDYNPIGLVQSYERFIYDISKEA